VSLCCFWCKPELVKEKRRRGSARIFDLGSDPCTLEFLSQRLSALSEASMDGAAVKASFNILGSDTQTANQRVAPNSFARMGNESAVSTRTLPDRHSSVCSANCRTKKTRRPPGKSGSSFAAKASKHPLAHLPLHIHVSSYSLAWAATIIARHRSGRRASNPIPRHRGSETWFRLRLLSLT